MCLSQYFHKKMTVAIEKKPAPGDHENAYTSCPLQDVPVPLYKFKNLIVGGTRIFCLKFVLIEFAIPSLSLIYFCILLLEKFNTSIKN